LSISVWAGHARPTESRSLVCKTVFFFLGRTLLVVDLVLSRNNDDL